MVPFYPKIDKNHVWSYRAENWIRGPIRPTLMLGLVLLAFGLAGSIVFNIIPAIVTISIIIPLYVLFFAGFTIYTHEEMRYPENYWISWFLFDYKSLDIHSVNIIDRYMTHDDYRLAAEEFFSLVRENKIDEWNQWRVDFQRLNEQMRDYEKLNSVRVPTKVATAVEIISEQNKALREMNVKI